MNHASIFVGVLLASGVAASCSSSSDSSSGAPVVLAPFEQPAAKARYGYVSATIGYDSPGDAKPVMHVGAYFTEVSGPSLKDYDRLGKKATCKKAASGACSLVRCTYEDEPSVASTPGKEVSAGAVTFTRGSGPAADVPQSMQLDYYFTTMDPMPFADGEMITFKAAGGAVPAFTATARFGGTPTMKAPKVAEHAAVSRNADFPLSWTGMSSGKLQFSFMQDGTATISAELKCEFDGASGAGVIPSGLLSLMDAGTSFSAAPVPKFDTQNVGGFELMVDVSQTLTQVQTTNAVTLELQ